MLNGELLRVAWRAISAHKLRSFLTLLGVIIGVMTVIAVVSVIQGLNNYVATKLFSLSPDVYTIERFGIITSRERVPRRAEAEADPEERLRGLPAALEDGRHGRRPLGDDPLREVGQQDASPTSRSRA